MDKCHRAVVVHPEQRRQEINHIADLECRVAELEATIAKLRDEVLKWRRIRTPTHGPCCTCQACGAESGLFEVNPPPLI